MPDILIRGMEMPKTCADCYDAGLPTAIAFLGTKCPRATGCPLHELPGHGDLIDRDKLSFVCGGTMPMGMDYVRRYVVDGMPVIVPSNKEETDG